VRAGFGKCQGGFCEEIVLKILSKELSIDPYDVAFSREGSFILEHEVKKDE